MLDHAGMTAIELGVRTSLLRLAAVGVATTLLTGGLASTALARAGASRARHHHAALGHVAAPKSVTAPLRFGIYPGGGVGTVGPAGPTRPELAAQRLAALGQLRGTRPFVVHLYTSYTGGGQAATIDPGVLAQIQQYTASGFAVELVLAYRPSAGADVAGFAAFVRSAARQLGLNPGVVALQITNEANQGGAPNASDGYYAGARDALIQGVIAAKDETVRDGFGQLKIGFNWAYATDQASGADFWSYLGQRGGAAFVGALDWVGVDSYPGTWGPQLASSDLATGVSSAIGSVLKSMRSRYLPLAGIPQRVAIHFSEAGYPTGPTRSYADQATALQAIVTAVNKARGAYNVTDLRWFDLRDSNSSSTSFEDQYGLMRDDYTPKPAFAVYQSLIAQLGGTQATARAASTHRSSRTRATRRHRRSH
jgi:hypothetical protein